MADNIPSPAPAKRCRFLYAQAVIYVLSVYIYPFLVVANISGTGGGRIIEALLRIAAFLMPASVLTLNIVAVCVSLWADKFTFFKCVMLIKYLLIPFYIVGGLFVFAAWCLFFIPVPGLNFIGPILGIILTSVGYVGIMMALPFSIAYFVKAIKAKLYHPAVGIALLISQFLFTADVITIMVLSFIHKKWVKVTIGGIALIIATIAGIIIWICAG